MIRIWRALPWYYIAFLVGALVGAVAAGVAWRMWLISTAIPTPTPGTPSGGGTIVLLTNPFLTIDLPNGLAITVTSTWQLISIAAALCGLWSVFVTLVFRRSVRRAR